MPIAPIKAINSSKTAKNFDASKAGGLQNKIILCKNCKVMLLSNIWKECGLTNGANGFIRYIVYDEGDCPPKLPKFVLVEFPQYTGPSFLETEPKLVPISPVTRNWFHGNKSHQRKMLPLTPAYSITIHKSQGQTLSKIIVNLGNKEYASGLTYTALSRTTHLQNIAFDPKFPPLDRFKSIFWTKRFQKRLAEEKRLSLLSIAANK